MHDSLTGFFENLWSSLKDRYDKVVAAFENGTVLQGLCKYQVDVGFFIAENGVVLALGAVTGIAARVVLRVIARVVEQGSELVRVGVLVTRLADSPNIAFDPLAPPPRTVPFYRDFNDADYSPAERKVLGEENQGTTTPDPKAKDEGGDDDGGIRPKLTARQRLEAFKKKVGQETLDLAASEGASPAQIVARKELKAMYAKEFGVNSTNLAGMSNREPLPPLLFHKGDVLSQWRNALNDNNIGEFFAPPGSNATPSQLGISSFGRTQEFYRTPEDGIALQGIGTPEYADTWTVKNRSVPTEGGVPQWVLGKEYRPKAGDRVSVGSSWRDLPENDKWTSADGETETYTSDEGTIRLKGYPDRSDPSKTFWQWEMVPPP